MRRISLITTVLILAANLLQAQAGWDWGDQGDVAKEKNAIYTDLLKNKKYLEAVEPMEWLLENAAHLNTALYINGVKIYDNLQKKESDAAQKKAYQDRCLELYDQRIQQFGKEGVVLNRKAYKAYQYQKDDKSKTKELYDLFEKTFKLNGNKVLVSNLVAYMDVIRRYKQQAGFSDEDILEKYGIITDILSNHIQEYEKAGKDPASLKKNQEFIDKMLVGMLSNMDCETIASKMAPGLDAQPADIAVAKRIIALSLTYKCTGEPFFLKAAKIVFAEEPTFGMGKLIAVKSDASKNYNEAQEYYQKTLELATTGKQRGEIHYGLANHFRARGMKSRARTSALEAVKNDASLSKAYKLVGDLYMGSYDDCRQGVSKVDDRAVFLAAYKMYQRAGDSRAMKRAEAQFPAMSEIFELSLKEGQTIKLGCWINETVTLKRRPSS